MLAVEKCRIERRIMLAVLGHGGADFTADEHLGLAVRTNRPAGFRWRAVDDLLHRKVLAVAQPHTKGDGVSGAAATLVDAFLPQRLGRDPPDAGRRRRWIVFLLRRALLKSAEQKIEQALSASEPRRRRAHRG